MSHEADHIRLANRNQAVLAYSSFSNYLPYDLVVPKLLNRFLQPFEDLASLMISEASRKALKRYTRGST